MTETILWNGMKKATNFDEGELHLERVENRVSVSMADVYGNCPKERKAFWIENKWAKNIGNHLHFQPGQQRWLKRQSQFGIQTFVLVGDDNSKMALYDGADFMTDQFDFRNCPDAKPIIVCNRNHYGFIKVFEKIQFILGQQCN